MTKKVTTTTTPWLGPLEQRREVLKKPVAKPDAEIPLGGPAEKKKGELALPESLVRDHGPYLEAAYADLAAISFADRQIDPAKKKQFQLALKRIFGLLGHQLDQTPPAERSEVARATAAAFKHLIDRTGSGAHTVPALYAMLGLLETGARMLAQKKLDGLPSARQAAAAVLDLLDRVGVRGYVSSALNVYSNIAEQLDRAPEKLTVSQRLENWKLVTEFLAGVAPKNEFSPAIVARLAELVAEAIEAAPNAGSKVLLASAKESYLADFAAARDAAIAELPPGELGAALQRAIAAHPSGPQALFDAAVALAKNAAAGELPQAELAAVIDHLAASPAAPNLLERRDARVPALAAAPDERGSTDAPNLLARRDPRLPAIAGAPHTRDASPAAPELLARLDALLPAIAASPAARAALTKLAASTPDKLAGDFLRLELATRNLAPETFRAPLAKLDALDSGLRPIVAAAVAPHADPALLDAAIALARTAKTDTPFQTLRSFAEKYATVAALIDQRPTLAPSKHALAKEIARRADDGVVPQFPALLDALESLRGLLPHADLSKLVDGSPGLLELLSEDFRSSPLAVLPQLLKGVTRSALGNGALQTELARVAFQLAAELGMIGPDRYLQRIAQDFQTAARTPSKLIAPQRAQNALGLRAQERLVSAAQYLPLVPELPPSVAFTAGLNLSAEQLGWVTQRISKNARDLSTARTLRDFIFACADTSRFDLLDAVRTAKSPAKAVTAVLDRVAIAFRTGDLAKLPLDSIIAGLKAGRDPISDIDRASDAGTLAGVDLQALTGGRVTEEGRAELVRCARTINFLLSIYVPGGLSYDPDIDMASLRPILLEAMKSVADGTWPKGKYENTVGQRLMSILSADQQAVWRTSLVTPMTAPGQVEDDARLREAIALLHGLLLALPEHIELGGPSLPMLGFDAASIDNLQVIRESLIQDLREHGKHTGEHRAAQKQLAGVQENLAILELHRALEQTIGAGRTDPAEIMFRLRPALERAAGPLATRGGEGFREAVEEILFATHGLTASPREGRYATDLDTFEALATSNQSGCLTAHWEHGAGRQWGIAGAVADANIRMLRVYNGERQVYRGFMKFFDAEFPGYKGPVMWLDPPVADGGGNHDDLLLWFRHAITKAAAMGVPLIYRGGIADAPAHSVLATLSQGLGLEVRPDQKVRLNVDEGNTGYMHSDTMFSGKGNIRADRGANPTWNFDLDISAIVMPPKAGG